MKPLAYHVNRNRPRNRPVILLQADRAGYLRGLQVCDRWNLATLQPTATRNVDTLRRAYPDYTFVLAPSRPTATPVEQWEALGNPGAMLA